MRNGDREESRDLLGLWVLDSDSPEKLGFRRGNTVVRACRTLASMGRDQVYIGQ